MKKENYLNKYIEKLFVFGLISLLIIIAVYLILQPIDLTTSDLGRHIKNGQMVLQGDMGVFTKNFFSYTHTEFTFINHHWLSGVFFYTVQKFFGWKGISYLGLFLQLCALGGSLYFIKKGSSVWNSIFWLVLIILLAGERIEVRPEIFSNLFLVVTLYILFYKDWQRDKRWLYFLVPLQFLWINLHIYSFLGVVLVGVAAADELIEKIKGKKVAMLTIREKIKNLAGYIASSPVWHILGLLFLVRFLNPTGYKSALYPLMILKNYGYEVVENKDLFFLSNILVNYRINLLLAVFIVGLLVLLGDLVLLRHKHKFFEGSVFVIFGFLGIFALRNMAMFALVGLPVLAVQSYRLASFFKDKFPEYIRVLGKGAVFVLVCSIFASVTSGYWDDQEGKTYQFGAGLVQENEQAGIFAKKYLLGTKIFNNYDIGSYLDYYLYPENKVFVDNRPEAYPAEFFEEYRQSQLDDELWEEFSLRYAFDVIIFSHADATPWGRNLVKKRLQDEQWVVVYADWYSIIFVRKDKIAAFGLQDKVIEKEKFEAVLAQLYDRADSAKNKENIINLALQADDNDLAGKLVEDLLSSNPGNVNFQLLYAQTLVLSGRPEELRQAERIIAQVIAAGFEVASTNVSLGIVRLRSGDKFGASRAFKRALELDANEVSAQYYLKILEQ
jgi:hypothetical protein